MGLLEFASILRFARGGEPSPEERHEIFREAALLTLARATSADTRIRHVEVETVRTVLRGLIDADVDAAEIRTAAKSELFEEQPLEGFLSAVTAKLDPADRIAILHGLRDVIGSDGRISRYEIDYFDTVARALDATPSEIAGLVRSET